MARRTIEVTITDEGRDKGKVFHITEMAAGPAEEWAIQVICAIASSGADIPDDVAEAGLAGLATLALPLLLKIPYYTAKPLLAQMFECITIIPDPGRPEVRRRLVEDDIEEVKTRIKLRREVLDLHVGFSVTAAIWILAADAKIKPRGQAAQMSPEPSISPAEEASPATPI